MSKEIEFVSFNYQIITANTAAIPAVSQAAFYGKGIYTTVAIHDQNPFVWDKHWRRLETDARKLGIDLAGFSENETKAALDELTRQNSIINGRSRITCFDESASDIWPFETGRKAGLLITTDELRGRPDNFRLSVSPWLVNSLSPLAGVKSCNYLDKIKALEEARSRDFDEAIQLNERGEVTSAVMANVFWLKNGVLFTPSLKTGCLPGTTREFVLENLECREVEAGIEAINSADAIFLTSAGIGVVAAAMLDGREFTPTSHSIMGLVSAAFGAG